MFHGSERGYWLTSEQLQIIDGFGFFVSEQLSDKADNFTAPATLNLIPLNGKQGTLQNVADIYGGRPISARGRKSRNKEEEVCLPHVCHFTHRTNSTILTLTVPVFPAWFICVTK